MNSEEPKWVKGGGIADDPSRTLGFLSSVLGEDDDGGWSAEDMSSMLMHQMSGAGNGDAAERVREYRRVKTRMKQVVAGKAGGVPAELARGMYYVVIARAWVEMGEKISQLTGGEVVRGLMWTIERAWVGGEGKARLAGLAEAVKRMDGGPG